MRARSRLAVLALAASAAGCVTYQLPSATYNPYGNVALRVDGPPQPAAQSNDIHVYHHGAPGQPGQPDYNWAEHGQAWAQGMNDLTDSMQGITDMQRNNIDFLRQTRQDMRDTFVPALGTVDYANWLQRQQLLNQQRR
ncbi:MAG TPA: hypothetical protein VJB16_02865 [archaeon]|nr:hypothetical protein [archaeon]